MGDEGNGYALGQAALRAVMRSFEQNTGPADIAQLARPVDNLAARGGTSV